MKLAELIENVNVPEADCVEFHSTGLPLLSLIPKGPRGVTYVKVPLYVLIPLAAEEDMEWLEDNVALAVEDTDIWAEDWLIPAELEV